MPAHLLRTLNTFLAQSLYPGLELCFATHHTVSHANGQPLNQVFKGQSRIRLTAAPDHGLPTLQVQDNLVFDFAFQFQPPTTQEYHQGSMLHLPRPLAQGLFQIDADQLLLSFRIDAPNPAHRVQVVQTYYGEFQTNYSHELMQPQ
ncbi:hypothetical protein [Flagellimonas flava]|uniref:Uncharacterized protein n=1 Tax=Flagellimonas flava TaxID=570519 RepID=A0A1M5K719_9FLAO|nr:hypothetical protein [Allomuricauda flava]SHG48602.1 hypothetical protein SAMN04488116_1418 [Allomuricauda flava]